MVMFGNTRRGRIRNEKVGQHQLETSCGKIDYNVVWPHTTQSSRCHGKEER